MSVKIVVASPGILTTKNMKPSSDLLDKSQDLAPVRQEAPAAGVEIKPQSKKPLAKYLSRGLSSTALITALLLSSIYVGLFKSFDWKDLAAQDSSKWIVAKAAIGPEYIYSRERRKIVILGSSLIMAPSENLNDLDGVAIGNPGSETAAPKGTIYVDALKKLTGQTLSTKVLGVPGAMTSDQALTTGELISGGKAPQLLVLTYAPRDFLSNDIGDDINFTPTARVFHFAALDHGFLPNSLAPQDISKCFDSHMGFIDSVRRFYLRSIREKTCQLTNHPNTLFESMHQTARATTSSKAAANVTATTAKNAQTSADATTAKSAQTSAIATTARSTQPSATAKSTGLAEPNAVALSTNPALEAKIKHDEVLAKDLILYRSRYLPINEQKIKTQMGQLTKMLSDAKKAKLPVVLVGMPLSEKNIEVLGAATRERLEKQIKTIAAKYGCEVYDFNDLPATLKFRQDEFIDSVHLNKTGSSRFVSLFSKTLSDTGAFANAFGKQ